MTVDYIRYDILTQDAMRSLVQTVLADAATGAPRPPAHPKRTAPRCGQPGRLYQAREARRQACRQGRGADGRGGRAARPVQEEIDRLRRRAVRPATRPAAPRRCGGDRVG